MENLYLYLSLISAFLFVVVFCILVVRLSKLRKGMRMDYYVAAAGSPHTGVMRKEKSVSLYAHSFRNKEGIPLKVDAYNRFIVKGESMALCGIHDKDIVFTDKKYAFSDNEAFPAPFVLKREMRRNGNDEDVLFKIRRGWKSVYYGTVDINEVLNEIMESEKFKTMIKCNDAYPGDAEIVKDFKERRLSEYIKKYNQEERLDIADSHILISTTLHTDEMKIYFSIHPVRFIVGKVLYAFTVA